MRLLFIGGCKSGKSSAAQRIAKLLGENAPLYYWATMEPHDDEDLARIRRHIADRDGWGFTTVERARHLTAGLTAIDPTGTVLFDSVTACLAAQMFEDGGMDTDAPRLIAAQLAAISRHPANFVCVCDGIFTGGEAYDPWTAAYVGGLAHICRTLAAEFDVVCEMTMGLPHLWKGALPRA